MSTTAVSLVVARRNSSRVAAVRSRAGRVLYACEGIGDDGEGFALAAALRWALDRGYVIVSKTGERVRVEVAA